MTNHADTSAAEAVRAQLTTASLSQEHIYAANAFERWRIVRAPLAPMDDRLVLAYLIDKSHWTWVSARTAVQKLDRYFTHHTGARLSGDLTKREIARRRKTAHVPLELTAPLRTQDAKQIAAELENTPDSPNVAAMRAGLILLRSITDPALPLKYCWRTIATLELTTTASTHQLRFRGGDPVTDLTSEAADIWRQHLTVLTNPRKVRGRARSAARRVGIDPDAPAAALTEAQWDWYWRALDSSLYRNIRDLAYLLAGKETARRHSELARLDLADITTHSDGISVRYFDTKRGKWLSYEVPHVGTDTPCPPECAACALSDLLTWQREIECRQTGPVFASIYGGQTRAMTRQNARLRIRKLTGLIADSPWGSTRSLRAGAATSAYEAGMSVQEIALGVTKHGTLEEARKYIRKTGAAGQTLQLRIEPTATPAPPT